jgi:hypothetical protein
VRVSVSNEGEVEYEREQKPLDTVVDTIRRDRLKIYAICLYVEAPRARAARKPIQEIYSAASKAELGIIRFADAAFTKRLILKFAPQN